MALISVSGGLRGGEVDIGDGDAAPGFCEALGNAEADAAGGAGDQGDAVVEVHGEVPFGQAAAYPFSAPYRECCNDRKPHLKGKSPLDIPTELSYIVAQR